MPVRIAASSVFRRNHDEFARGFIGHQFGGMEVVQEVLHHPADGCQLWVIDADYFDAVMQGANGPANAVDTL